MNRLEITYKWKKMKPIILMRFSVILWVVLMVFGTSSTVSAQQGQLQWSPPEQIPDYEQFTEEPPFLIADRSGIVHAFNSQSFDQGLEFSEKAVLYRQWTRDQGWSEPNDIIVDPNGGSVDLLDVYFDQVGTMHLLIQMNNQDIFHSQSPLIFANRAFSWSDPQQIGSQSQPLGPGLPHPAAIMGDDRGNLVVLFGGYQDGPGIYAVHSSDVGENWSNPATVYLTFDSQLVPGDIDIALSQSGKIHTVWSTFDQRGFGNAGYYASSDFGDMNWSQPMELDIPGVRTPTLIDHVGSLFITYYHHTDNHNYWRVSRDDGATWSEPEYLSQEHVGTNGAVSFVVDSNDNLHVFFGQRIDNDRHGLWQSKWTGSVWEVPTAVIVGAQVKDRIGGMGFDPRSAKAALINGNILLVTWGTDGTAGENGAWYSHTVLDSPVMPIIPLPVPEGHLVQKLETEVNVLPPKPTQISSRTVSVGDQGGESGTKTENPMTLIAISIIPFFMLSIILIVAKRLHQ